jgi:Eco29kI restriction endonuclease
LEKKPPYNPLDKLNLGLSIAKALLETDARPLAENGQLRGAGVYAIYYIGSFRAYAPIAARNRDDKFGQPIYVGKAIPKGGRKGGLAPAQATGTALRDRLRQHAVSINQTRNLELADFFFRSLVIDDIWIPLGENMLIEQFKPVWNLVIDGFGNNDPGVGRTKQKRSPWDVLHPGRAWAEKLADSGISEEQIIAKISRHFADQTD